MFSKTRTQPSTAPSSGRIEQLWRALDQADAVVVGAGGLGKAFLGYEGFRNNGLNIVAAFDADPARVGTTVGGIKVFPADELARLVRRLNREQLPLPEFEELYLSGTLLHWLESRL